jgi:hypothetical protein
MTHPIHRVTRFEIVGPYTLSVVFADGTTQEINFRPVLHGALFGPLRALAAFNAVALDHEVGTLTWPNGADFDPATLHECPSVCAELAARAQAWAEPTIEPRANTRMEPTRR